ncbi:MAG: trigger factor [Kofleriaceae bacterium]|nr:trigger factor [Kofleriaceae bacterium]
MQVRIEDVSPVEKKMIVEVPWETVSAKLNDAYREFGKGVALKGFRKGKVPRPVLEQVYGGRVMGEVAYQLVQESFYKANAEHKLAAVAEPRIEEAQPIKKGQPFSFKAIVEVRGDFEPKDYKGLAIEKRRLAIAEDAVNAAIENLRREHTELMPIEGRTITAAGDIVGCTVTGTIGEHQVNQPQFAVDLDDEERTALPGLREALTGLPLDTKDHKVVIDVPADYKDESTRGRKAELNITFLEVRVKAVPNLDDDFAKDTGKAETFEALRQAIRDDLENAEKLVILREAKEGVMRELIKANQIPVASTLIERAVEMQYSRFRQMLGMKPEQGNAGLSDEMRTKMRPAGTDEVRGQMLLDAIAGKEQIEVNDQELDVHVAATAKQRNTPPAKLKAEWMRDGRLENVRFSLRQDKVMNFLVDAATVTEVEKLTAVGVPVPETDAGHGQAEHVHGPDCNH